jgi:co-chaperonin GroES (HSP10)
MIKPLNRNVVVRPIKPETKTATGLIVPGSNAKTAKGEVIAIGDSSLRIGDIVIYPLNAGTEHGDHLVIDVSELLAVID